jgi:diaminohydroxyphosphoribosylaminopyrimidine deaminase/5-amino-6-(5-phosphoribosylamino)uracil reductase
VSLEPCNHHGKTPPCTDAILAAGIRRVVVGVRDPHLIAAGGIKRLRDAGVNVVVGVEEEAARELNAAFLHAQVSSRPFVRLKLAMSLDGAITDASRARAWLTGPAARAEVHRVRAGCDAVAIGIGTAVADDPMLTVRDVDAPRVQPTRVVFDTSAHLPLTARLVTTARETPTIVVCWAPDPAHAAALEHAGVTLVHAASLTDALANLRSAGIRDLLVEGGAALASSFIQEHLVDRLIIFRAPIILGAGAVNAFAALGAASVEGAQRWRLLDARRFGDDEMTVYAPPAGAEGAI